jgi:phosphonatase-like hydrolase
MKIELVVFDMAGTTVSEGGAVYRCLQDTLAANGLAVAPEAVQAVKGMDKREALRLLIERSAPASPLLAQLDESYAQFAARMIEFYRTDTSVAEMPGASETFRRLRSSGVKVALNTGFSRVIAQTIIDRLGWQRDGLLDATVTSDEVERGRPHPDMIGWLMELTEVRDPQRVAKVGDTSADLLEGKNAGCGLVIGVTQGSQTRAQLAAHPHDYLIETIAELPALLGL